MDIGAIIDLARSMGLILGLAFYVAIVIWTYKDARKRTDDPIMVATFTAISMLPVFGVLIYMLVRPSEYIADVRERELEIRALERQLGRQERCPYCKSHIEGEYLSCPVCTTKLRQSCTGCEKPLDPRWVMCPFCETEVPGKAGRAATPSSGGASSGRRAPSVARGRETTPPRREATAAPKERSARGDRDARPSRASKDKTSSASATEQTAVTKKPSDIETEPFV